MLSIARKLSDTPPPFQAVGTITARDGAEASPWRVRAASGDYEARRAVSCLVEPAVDDTVLLTVLPTGECYVLAILERAVAAGGQMGMPVTDMGEMVGSIGFFVDTEGNRIGVHKPPNRG